MINSKILVRPNTTAQSNPLSLVMSTAFFGTSKHSRFSKTQRTTEIAGSVFVTFAAEESSKSTKMPHFKVPDTLSEEALDKFLVESGAIDRLISQLSAAPRNPNWEAELDEL